ncbi:MULTISPECIES: hypothetical protein [Spirulina sp. CCY15215]|uniref:hypothetical protein n=1 Tax=Spirulina sp. CCY15215 TaxID=2767591 RepID=UPI00194EF2AF|nr:hypothetical protein [Spirulina major]
MILDQFSLRILLAIESDRLRKVDERKIKRSPTIVRSRQRRSGETIAESVRHAP